MCAHVVGDSEELVFVFCVFLGRAMLIRWFRLAVVALPVRTVAGVYGSS